MRTFRRRSAVLSLTLMLAQTALVFAAPLSACCPGKTAAAAVNDECCPPGSHPPGQCPRHARSQQDSRESCRLQCDAPHGAQFVAAVGGMLPAPAPLEIPSDDAGAIALASAAELLRASIPTSPPPRA